MSRDIPSIKPAVVSTLWAGLCITLFSLIVYGQTLSFGFVNFDDDGYVYENARVLAGLNLDNLNWSFGFSTGAYWHPLVWLSLMLDVTLFGTGPFGFHATNVFLHTLNGILLFSLLTAGTLRSGMSLMIALLFTVHPMNVESVAWIVERKNLLSTFFMLASCRLYVCHATHRRFGWYLGAWSAFVLGLMSKPNLVILPGLLLLLDLWPLERIRFSSTSPGAWLVQHRRVFLEKVPFIAASIGTFWLVMYALTQDATVATGSSIALSLRIENAIVSCVSYIGHLVLPLNLACYYPFPTSIPLIHVVASAVIVITFTTAALLAFRRFPALLTGWFWYLIALLPVIGLIQAGLWPERADRFMYVPMIGLLMAVLGSIPESTATSGASWRRWLPHIGMTFLLFYTVCGWKQASHWRNGVTLFRQAVEVMPDNFFARNNLGNSLLRVNRIPEAIEEFQTAIAITPGYALSHNNLGVAWTRLENDTEAAACFRRALELSPEYVDALINLGVVLCRQGDLVGARACFQSARQLRPDSETVAHYLESLRQAQSESAAGFPPEGP